MIGRRFLVFLTLAGTLALSAPVEAAGVTVTFTHLTTPAPRNSFATARVHTKAGARCDINVTYSSGVSHAAGLQNKTANSSGNVSWTWKIGASTKKGYWPVKVACSKSGSSGSRTKTIHVT